MEGHARTNGLWLRSNGHDRMVPTCKSALICCDPASEVYTDLSSCIVGILQYSMFLLVLSCSILWSFIGRMKILLQSSVIPVIREVVCRFGTDILRGAFAFGFTTCPRCCCFIYRIRNKPRWKPEATIQGTTFISILSTASYLTGYKSGSSTLSSCKF